MSPDNYRLTGDMLNAAVNVLHVRTVCGNGGGPEKTILRGADYLPSLGIRARALYLIDARTSSDALRAAAARCSMPVEFVCEKSALDMAGTAAFSRMVRNEQVHIVHTHDYKSNALARLFAPTAAYRIVATAHGYNQTTAREGYYYALEKLLLRRADAVICPSHGLVRLLADAGVGKKRLCYVPNGIEVDRWQFQPRCRHGGPARLLYVGRLNAEKNVAALLEAVAVLAAQGRKIRLDLAGEGPEMDSLQRTAREHDLEPLVRFLGRRDDVAALLAETDVMINPSLTEGMPNSVLEALACGAPVVATDVGATSELIRHEYTGLLVPPADVPALVLAIRRLLDLPEFAQSLAIGGRAHVEANFSFANRMAHVVAIYRGVLALSRRCA